MQFYECPTKNKFNWPEGYKSVCGDVAGKFAAGNINFSDVKNIKDCGEKCKQESKCIGYEYQASGANCYLNYGCQMVLWSITCNIVILMKLNLTLPYKYWCLQNRF